MIQLRDYQDDITNKIATEFDAGHRRICTVLGCGGGKTVIFSYISGRAKLKGNDVLILQHRAELIQQTSETLTGAGISHGIIAAGMPVNLREKIQVASVQTVARRLNKINKPRIIIIDECHHSLANTWRKILTEFPGALVIGMTATPARTSGQGLGDIFDSLVEGPSVKELIETGYLSPYRYYAPTTVDTEGIKIKMGDFASDEIEIRVNKPAIIGDCISHYLRLASGKQGIVYCASVAHSKNVADAFNGAGINARHVDGTTPADIRERTMRDFRAGRIQILTNVDLFGEGFDVPGAEAVILLRPTQSLTLYIQQAMRGMRIDPGNKNKTCIILDHCGNVFRHGLPDEDRTWSLDGIPKQKKSSPSEFPIRQCPRCYSAFKTAPMCPMCGYVFPIEQRAEIETVQGELVEVLDLERKQRKMEVGRARTVEELEKIAMQRGYSPGWVIKWCGFKRIEFNKEVK